MKVLFVIAFKGFRDEEFQEPKQILEDGGIEVVVSSTEVGIAEGKLGMKAKVSCLYDEQEMEGYAALVFIGGPGSPSYWNDVKAHELIRSSVRLGKVTAAICSGCVTLAKAGVLSDKKATVFPGDGEVFAPLVGDYTKADCQQDGNFVTANGPGSATVFGETILKMLIS